MKIARVFFHLIFAGLISAALFAQEENSGASAAIDDYALTLAVDVEHHTLHGDASIRFRVLKDSLPQIHLTLSPSMEVRNVRDSLDKKMEVREQAPQSGSGRKEISVFIPDTLKYGTPFTIKIVYDAVCNTDPTSRSFVNEGEILLASDDTASFWPLLSKETDPSVSRAGPTLLDVTLPSSFTVIPSAAVDSANATGPERTWRLYSALSGPPYRGFLFCASREVVRIGVASADSSVELLISYAPARFDRELAEAVLRQIRDAYAYFESVTGIRPHVSSISVAIIGTDDGRVEWLTRDSVIVGRNSFAYSVFDSTLLLSGRKNRWVHELAHLFAFTTTDSTYWFNEGWASFLTTKFFLHLAGGETETQRVTRLALFSSTLDFYPSPALAQGRGSGKNEEAVFFKRGACVFLVLQYVLGEETFGAVTKKMFDRFLTQPITIPAFQELCEEMYGTSLDWFFKEWVYRSSFPELILSTEVTQTNRGNYVLKARISQRGDLFITPVDLVITGRTRSITKRMFVERQDQEFEFVLPFLPVKSELDPNYFMLRWVPRLRLLAHARTAVSFRVFDRDLVNSEREATLMLQLDPNNLSGWNNLALFSLGKSAVLKGGLPSAEEYFRRASTLDANEPTQLYSVLSLIRLGNVLEMEGKREQAVEMYKWGATLAERNPTLYDVALFEARKYLHQPFVSSDAFWYGEY